MKAEEPELKCRMYDSARYDEESSNLELIWHTYVYSYHESPRSASGDPENISDRSLLREWNRHANPLKILEKLNRHQYQLLQDEIGRLQKEISSSLSRPEENGFLEQLGYASTIDEDDPVAELKRKHQAALQLEKDMRNWFARNSLIAHESIESLQRLLAAKLDEATISAILPLDKEIQNGLVAILPKTRKELTRILQLSPAAFRKWENEIFLKNARLETDREIDNELSKAKLLPRKARETSKKIPKFRQVQKDVNQRKKAHPGSTIDNILHQVAESRKESYESVKKNYYYKPKELPKKLP